MEIAARGESSAVCALAECSSLRRPLSASKLSGVLRYPWSLVRPVMEALLNDISDDWELDEQVKTRFLPRAPPPHASQWTLRCVMQVEVGPAPPPEESTSGMRGELLDGLRQLDGYPWTAQRLSELLLEPRNQYSRFAKFARAVQMCLQVTSTLPCTADPGPRPLLSELPKEVNIVRGSSPGGTRPGSRAAGSAAGAGLGGPLDAPPLERLQSDSDLNLAGSLVRPVVLSPPPGLGPETNGIALVDPQGDVMMM